jgi:hypothetical protein
MLAGILAHFAADVRGHCGDRLADGFRRVRVGGLQLGAHPRGGRSQELEEMLARNVGTHADVAREPVVAAGAFHQLAETLFREARAAVLGHRDDDPAVAVIDQDVGDRLAQARALGDRVQMVLAAGAGVGDQILVGELGRRPEHGSGDRDAVVEGE